MRAYRIGMSSWIRSFGLRLQEIDRVRPIGRRRPLRVAAPGDEPDARRARARDVAGSPWPPA